MDQPTPIVPPVTPPPPAAAPALSGVLAALDSVLPRLWKTWLITGVALAIVIYLVSAPLDRMLVYLAKLPLLTLGALVGFGIDRGVFPYARPGDIYDKVNAVAALPTEREGATEGQNLVAWLWTFGVACIRRALIVAACVLASALAA